MSHEIETMFSVREKPWHYEQTQEVTKIIQEAPTSAEALELAGLDWNVVRKPIFDETAKEIPGYFMNIRETDNKILGVISDRYALIQNKDAFDFTDALVGEGLKYETAGSLRGGKQVWLLGKLENMQIAGDEIESYICFTNSHDGMGAVRCFMTPIRVVCNNTLNFAIKGAKRMWATNHVGNIQNKLTEAKEVLFEAHLYLYKLNELGEQLANEKMTEDEMRAATAILLPTYESMSDRQIENNKTMRDGIIACTLAPDLIRFANTKWQFMNAVADYVDHMTPFRKAQNWKANRWGKIMNGHGLVDRALALVTEGVA